MKPTGMEFKQIIPDLKVENINMIGYVNRNGVQGGIHAKLLRTLRYKNITSKVEKKFGLTDNILLAMIMQETGGADLLPNSSDDGGLGLCHMQPVMAKQFGLKTYKNCNKMICRKHGRELRALIKKHHYKRKNLIQFDDRFHPILNIDAAGRMLAYYRAGRQYKKTPLATAIYGYAGSKNFPKYYKNVKFFLKILSNRKIINQTKQRFNTINPHLTINGAKAGFDDYIEAHQKQLINYGIENYK